MNLREIEVGIPAYITGFSGEHNWLERLIEMGLHKGMTVKIMSKAPFGGPLVVQVGTSFLALREEEAACIVVQSPT